MANAGFHPDTKLLKHMIRQRLYLRWSVDDNKVVRYAKDNFNALVFDDQIKTHRWNGKDYDSHSAWDKMYNVLTKVNQLRTRHWYHVPLSYDLLYSATKQP